MVLRMVEETTAVPEPPISLAAVHALYAVDLDQRIVSWDDRSSQQLRPRDQVIGRRCYEVLANIDPRNALLCRPNCPVITQARTGRPAQDFDVWAQASECSGPSRVRVSILLQEDGKERARVIHMVRRVDATGEVPLGARLPNQRPFHPTPKPGSDPAAFAESRVAITPRQVAALRLLAEGCSPDEIASVMDVRPITVRNHIQAAMDRLGARTRLEAVILASRAGLLGDAV